MICIEKVMTFDLLYRYPVGELIVTICAMSSCAAGENGGILCFHFVTFINRDWIDTSSNGRYPASSA
jgi:hypothetical protein